MVNEELAAVEITLPRQWQSLNTGGRCAVISFHSLEDRIVKDFFESRAKIHQSSYERISEEERKAVVKIQ